MLRENNICTCLTCALMFLYLGASSGGVWKTTDGGRTWAPLTDNLALHRRVGRPSRLRACERGPGTGSFDGAGGGFAGLDQVNWSVRRSLIGKGEGPIIVTIDGKQANTVSVAFK